MIYDSPEQKQFILEAIKKFPTNYENALQLCNAFGVAIQGGRIIPVAEQNKALPPIEGAEGDVNPGNPPGGPAPLNRRTRRAANKAKGK